MSSYHDGRRVEYAVIKRLQKDGYDTIRGASSKGIADVVAIKPGQVLLVNVKKTDPPGPAERADVLRIAAHLPGVGVPLVALGPVSKLTFRRLTGHGPADWVPWTSDEILEGGRTCQVCKGIVMDDEGAVCRKCGTP